MQRASLPQPPKNLVIIRWHLDDTYSGKQLWTADRKKQVVNFVGTLIGNVSGNLLLVLADVVRFMVRLLIAAKQCSFVFHQRGNRKRRLARSGDVVQPHKPEKVCRKAALRVVGGAIAV